MNVLIISLLTISTLIFSSERTKPDTEVTSYRYQVPILKLKSENSILIIKVESRKKRSKTIVKSIKLNFDNSDNINDIAEIKIYYLGKDSLVSKNAIPILFGESLSPENNMEFIGEQKIVNSTAYFMVSVQLADNANLHNKIKTECTEVRYKNDSYSIPVDMSPQIKQRIGVAVRQHMDDNVNTYRIPGLTTTNKGTLLAVYDVRHEGSRDLQGDIDIGVSRSVDGGNTWEPMKMGLDMGEWGNLPEKFNGVSDPTILVDPNSETIFLTGLWMYGVINKHGKWIEGLTEERNDWNHQWRNKGTQPGTGVKQSGQFLIAKSTDDGQTWGEAHNITEMCKNPLWWLLAPAPGRGITLSDGTLVIPSQGRDEKGFPFSNITYSKDGGEIWTTSNHAYSNTTESQAVQLSDGSIMLNMRYNQNRNNDSDTNGRVVMITKDLGETWTEHSSSRSALIESTCMASIHEHIYHGNGEQKSILLFSNPNTKKGRHHMTIKVSFDDGKTWPEKYWMLLDAGNSRGYSCLTSIDENTIGILYEGSQADMTFESIPLSEILDK